MLLVLNTCPLFFKVVIYFHRPALHCIMAYFFFLVYHTRFWFCSVLFSYKQWSVLQVFCVSLYVTFFLVSSALLFPLDSLPMRPFAQWFAYFLDPQVRVDKGSSIFMIRERYWNSAIKMVCRWLSSLHSHPTFPPLIAPISGVAVPWYLYGFASSFLTVLMADV